MGGGIASPSFWNVSSAVRGATTELESLTCDVLAPRRNRRVSQYVTPDGCIICDFLCVVSSTSSLNLQEFRQHLREFVSPSSPSGFAASSAALEGLARQSVHDTVCFCLEVFNDPEVCEGALKMVCVLILQALRPSPVAKECSRLVHGKRRVWMDEKNVEVRARLYEAMVRGLGHSCGEVRNVCAANVAYAVWLDESDWYRVGEQLGMRLFDERCDVSLRKGCVRCFVEMLELRVIDGVDSEDGEKWKLLERLKGLFMELGVAGSVDADLRVDAVNGLRSLLSVVPSLFANAAMVDQAFDMVGEGLKTANSDVASVMQRFLLEIVKQFYSYADSFIAKAASLIEMGINSKDGRCQVIAMEFWYELAQFEKKQLETSRNLCKEYCSRISHDMCVTLCNVLLRVPQSEPDDLCVDTKNSVPAMALLTLKAFYSVASQQVFLVISQFFSDHINSESWESVCAAVNSLRCLCACPHAEVVKKFLMESIRELFDSKLQADVHPMLRIEAIKTLRAFVKTYPQLISDEYFLGIVEKLFPILQTSDVGYLSSFSRLLVDVSRFAPASWNDKALANGASTLIGKALDPTLSSLRDTSLAISSLIQFASPASRDLVAGWVPDLIAKLQDPQLPLATKFSVSLIIKAIADKLVTEFPQTVPCAEVLLTLMNNEGISEETLMCLSSLMLCGRKTLSPYFERIWSITKCAFATGNPTLVDVAYCTLGSAFAAFGNETAGLMHDILDAILSIEIPTERLVPYLKCIGCIVQSVGSLVTDDHRDRILEIMKSTTDDIIAAATDGDEDCVIVKTVLHVYSMMFVGCSSTHSGARNEAFMRLLCKPVFAFVRVLHAHNCLLSDDILHEIFLLMFTIGKSLGAQANVPLNSSKVKDLIKRGLASPNPQLASEAKFLMNYIENL